MSNPFDRAKRNFGFGFMRLPMAGEEVDLEHTTRMVDRFLELGFNYFDTAHGYINGKSELALKACLTSRYPRDRYVLTNKLSGHHFNTQEDIRPLFQSQLEACGVEYFDFYLMHAQNRENFVHYKNCRAYETALELKAEGKIRHLGISFHDTAEVLDQILTEYPQVEAVQIQFNYLDFEDHRVQSRLCYEVCRKHNKPVIVMEPVKGGKLVELSADAQQILDRLQGGSNASYAIRFAAGFEGIAMVLSGMGNMEMIEDNCGYMADFTPLSPAEREAVEQVSHILRQQSLVPCTACRYCTEGCPQAIPIPEIFACLNKRILAGGGQEQEYAAITKDAKAGDCIECGLCENVCPQHIEVRKLLKSVARTFER